MKDLRRQEKMSKIYSPLNGSVKALELVDDVAFSEKMMGDGIAVTPSSGELFAPADGEITMLFPTKHAIGLTTKEGVELLIHIGIDTVSLNGEGFNANVEQNDQVRKGDLLISFDLKGILDKGYDMDTMIVITNSDKYVNIKRYGYDKIVVGEELLDIL